jgi:hypothetical protein
VLPEKTHLFLGTLARGRKCSRLGTGALLKQSIWAVENIGRWRMLGAGEWQALENGRRWRRKGAGEFRAPAPYSARRDRKRRDLVLCIKLGWYNPLSKSCAVQSCVLTSRSLETLSSQAMTCVTEISYHIWSGDYTRTFYTPHR